MMTLTPKHRAVLRTLAIASEQGRELRGIEIIEQTRVPFLIFWERNISFSEVYPLLADLVKAGLVTGRLDTVEECAITGAYPRYYRIV